MKLTLVGFIFIYEKVRIFVLNKSEFMEEKQCDAVIERLQSSQT